MNNRQIAIDYLDAARTAPGVYQYTETQTGTWEVYATDLHELGAALRAETPDAYSLWCGATAARKVA